MARTAKKRTAKQADLFAGEEPFHSPTDLGRPTEKPKSVLLENNLISAEDMASLYRLGEELYGDAWYMGNMAIRFRLACQYPAEVMKHALEVAASRQILGAGFTNYLKAVCQSNAARIMKAAEEAKKPRPLVHSLSQTAPKIEEQKAGSERWRKIYADRASEYEERVRTIPTERESKIPEQPTQQELIARLLSSSPNSTRFSRDSNGTENTSRDRARRFAAEARAATTQRASAREA